MNDIVMTNHLLERLSSHAIVREYLTAYQTNSLVVSNVWAMACLRGGANHRRGIRHGSSKWRSPNWQGVS
jgi:hypothetical protein